MLAPRWLMQSHSIRETEGTYFQVWPFTLAEWIEAEEIFLGSGQHVTLRNIESQSGLGWKGP